MDELTLSLVLAVLLFALLASGVWVAATLFIVAFAAMALANVDSAGMIMATSTWGASSAWTLTALPLFIWMGEILFRTRLAQNLFRGLVPWLSRVPGRLLHVNILGCGLFAAGSGSSAATCATVGRMTLPELARRGYAERLAVGTLAGSATLGLLIPPSLILIVYGVSAELSIARLFIAGAVPGVLLTLMFMAYTMLVAGDAGERDAGHVDARWKERFLALRELAPTVGLIALVIGAIYLGWATAMEAAVLGVAGSLLVAAASGSLSRASFTASLMGAVRTSCMVAFILAGAAFLTVAMGFTGIPRALAEWVGSQQFSPPLLLAALTLLFILLGCFLDGISIVVLTTSVILPLVTAAGIDPLWFGIYLVLVVEMSQITPPVGFNLFVIQGLTGRDMLQVAVAALPFFFIILAAIVLVAVFPQLVTWLPARMSG